MVRGDRVSGGAAEVEAVMSIRSARVRIGESVRDAHATFVSLCKIGPAILFRRNKFKDPTKSDETKRPYLAYP